MKKLLGYSLFFWSFAAWGATFALPFIGLEADSAFAIASGLIISAEIAFVLSLAILGKEFWSKIKAWFRADKTDIE